MKILDEMQDISEFVPTRKQLLTKLKLHQYVNPQTIGTLMPSNLVRIRPYLYPATVDEVELWSASNPSFWHWFIMPNEQIERMHKAKDKAMDTLERILEGSEPDSKLAAVQLKTAQLLLGLSDKPQMQTTVTKNTMNVSSIGDVPKALEKKQSSEIANEILRLRQAHSLNEEDA